MNKKILIATVFATLILTLPMISADDINIDVDDEAREDFEIEPLDDYIEIVSWITGKGYTKSFWFFDLDIYDGDIDIKALTINGNIYTAHASSVKAKFFIGWGFSPGGYWIDFLGFAFGNIDWS